MDMCTKNKSPNPSFTTKCDNLGFKHGIRLKWQGSRVKQLRIHALPALKLKGRQNLHPVSKEAKSG